MLKGCLFFIALFVIGLGLFAGGLAHDVLSAGTSFQDAPAGEPPPRQTNRDFARNLEVAGVALVFGSMFGAAGWRFYKRDRSQDPPRPKRL